MEKKHYLFKRAGKHLRRLHPGLSVSVSIYGALKINNKGPFTIRGESGLFLFCTS